MFFQQYNVYLLRTSIKSTTSVTISVTNKPNMGNTASQLEQLSANQSNIEKQTALLTELTNNINKLVVNIRTSQTHNNTALSAIQDLKSIYENPPVVVSDIKPDQEDPITTMFEKELSTEERAEFICKVIVHLTQNSADIVENKDNKYGKSIAEILHEIGMIICKHTQ